MHNTYLDWTDDELDKLLRMLAEGHRIKQIAHTLETTYRSVQWGLERLRDRYGAKTTAHLIALAYQRGTLKTS